MKVVHVVPSIDNEASGPSHSVPSLSNAMRRAGVDSRVAFTSSNPGEPSAGIEPFPRRAALYRLGRSPELAHWLEKSVRGGSADIVHNNGLWMMPNVYAGWATRRSKVPLVVSPRGTMSKWAMNRSRLVKSVFWQVLQHSALAGTALFHATAESELQDVRRLGFRQPVAVIPNGIDIPDLTSPQLAEDRQLLFLSRVHPKKGIEMLLDAWSRLQFRHPEWTLTIAGPADPSYLEELKARAKALAAQRVTFLGPVFGPQKLEAYQAAELLVLPTHSENFGMVVAEAQAAGRPVVTTKGAPWGGLVEHRSGWWCDVGVAPLEAALGDAMSQPPRVLTEMGARGRDWMKREFSWDRIAAMMLESYRWILEGGTHPAWVHRD